MTTLLSRRGLLGATAGLAALGGLSACGQSGTPAQGGGGPIRFTWWGGEFYDQLTKEMVGEFTKVNPEVEVQFEPGSWDGYWDRLATQVAGSDAPDVINMDGKYVAEYATRGVLADLSEIGVDLSALSEGDRAAGTIDGSIRAASTGSNSWLIFANPSLFDRAGIDLPDDTSWTWDDLFDLATGLTGDGVAGFNGGGSYADLTIFLRQHGQDFFGPDGLGYTNDTLAQWYAWYLRLIEGKTGPTAEQEVEDAGLGLEQKLFGTNKAAMSWFWTNNLTAVRTATGHDDVVMLRPPSTTADVSGNGAYLKASMYWSINARSANLETAAALVDFLVNDPAAARIQLLNRGVPSSAAMLEAMEPEFTPDDVEVAELITALGEEITTAPAIQPTGTSEAPAVLTRNLTEVRFKRLTPDQAAERTTQELQEMIRAAS